ncbi:MAG: hypothetical protein AB7E96_02045 [Deferribacterales bacterium]
MKRIFLILALMALPLYAMAGIFDITIAVDAYSPYYQSFDSVEDMIDELDTDQILSHFAGYDEDTSSADVEMNFRGVPITLSFATNSTKLILSIPSIGVYEEFNGSDRDDSVDMLKDWFEKDGGDALTALQKELISETPSDPIAGNPSSLMSRMVSMDFDQAVNPDSAVEINGETKSDINANMISVFAKYGNYTTDGVKTKEYAIPLAYTIRFNNTKNTLAIRMPISMVSVEDSKAYNLGLGLALGYYVNDRWKLTPSVGYGAVGSIDMGSVGQIISGSLTSVYTFKLKKFDILMGNMLGHYKTIPFKTGDYSIDPDIQNTVLRNGLNFVIPVSKATSLELFGTDTRYYGSDLFIDTYNEVGFSYGFRKSVDKETSKGIKNYASQLRGGLTYLFSDESHGFTFNFGFVF